METFKIYFSIFKKTPWIAMIFCKPSIAIFFAHFSSNFGMYFIISKILSIKFNYVLTILKKGIYLFLTSLPTFLKDVLKYDIKSVSDTHF